MMGIFHKEMYHAEEYASRLDAFHEQGFESTYDSDLFGDYTELCTNDYCDDYEGTLYNHDRFFYGIELSPELEKMIRNDRDSEDSVEIESISSVRRIIKFTSYGQHFKKATSK